MSVNTGDDVLARTMGLTTFSFGNLFYGLACNDRRASVFSHALLANAKLLQMSAISLGFIIIGNELDLLNRLLNTTSLNIEQWVVCAAAGSVILWVMEVIKFFGRRGPAAEPVATEEPMAAPAQA